MTYGRMWVSATPSTSVSSPSVSGSPSESYYTVSHSDNARYWADTKSLYEISTLLREGRRCERQSEAS